MHPEVMKVAHVFCASTHISKSGCLLRKGEWSTRTTTGSLWFPGGLFGRSRYCVRSLTRNAPYCYSYHCNVVLPYKRHIPSILHLTPEEKASFADALSVVTKRYDNLFSCSFAYSMGIHQRPLPSINPELAEEGDIAHLHLHFAPPLLRSASIRKFLVG